MKIKSTQRKSLATVPSGYQGQERKFAQSVSESLDILTGRRGDIIDRAVTFRDLLDTGVLKLVKAIGTGSTTGGTTVVNPNTDPDGFPIQLPTQPENFVASGGFDVIFLSWTLPPYNGHDYVEIYRLQRASGAAEPTLAQAEAAGVYTRYYGDTYRFTDTNVGSQENWYYWIRAVNKNGISGPYYSSTGVNATTALDYLYISGLIDDILDDDVNNLGLNTAIDAIDVNVTALENFTGYTSSYNGDSLIVRMGDVETVAGNAATSAQLQVESTTRANADSALSTQITTLNSTVTDPTTGLAATYSGLQTEITTRANADSALSTRATNLESTVNDATTGVAATYSGLVSEQTTRANADSAIASDVSILSVTVGNNTSSISTVTSAVSGPNGVESKYAVKVDTNGYVAGFGLIQTANDGNVTSAFVVSADRFAIAAPFNATSAQDAAVGTNYPFKVFTTATTVNGVSIPAGVYIDDAFIHNAQITNAMVKDATITTAKIFDLTADKITSGNIQITAANDIKIYQGKTSFTSNTSGFWLGLNNNAGSFHVGANSSKYLKFDGNAGDLITSGLEVRASDGTLLLDSGGTAFGSGANVIPNGFLFGGPDNTSTFVWGDDASNTSIIPFWEVADQNNGRTTQPNVSYWTPSSGGVVQLFYGSTFRSTEQVPCFEGEVYYLAIDNYMNNNVLQWQAQIQFSDSSKNYVSGTQINLPPTSSLWDEPPVSSSQGAVGTPTLGTRYSVAQITVPSNSNIRYMRVRFYGGSYTGTTSDYVNIKAVYLGKVPPVIGPKYTSTYIRDLAVDTLQIAGNAVTVPLGASNENISSGYYLSVSGTQTSEGTSWAKVCDLSAMSWTSSNTAPEAITLVGSMNYAAATSGSSHESVRLKLIMRAGATVPATYISSGFSATSDVTELQSCGVSKQRNHSGTLTVNFTLDVSQYNLQPNTNYYFALVGQTNAGLRRMFNNGLSAVASKK